MKVISADISHLCGPSSSRIHFENASRLIRRGFDSLIDSTVGRNAEGEKRSPMLRREAKQARHVFRHFATAVSPPSAPGLPWRGQQGKSLWARHRVRNTGCALSCLLRRYQSVVHQTPLMIRSAFIRESPLRAVRRDLGVIGHLPGRSYGVHWSYMTLGNCETPLAGKGLLSNLP